MLSQGHGEIYEIESAVMKLRPTEHKTDPEPQNDSLLSDIHPDVGMLKPKLSCLYVSFCW